MKFQAYDAVKGKDCVTEIRSVEISTADLFVQTWVPSFLVRKINDFSLQYALFPWDKVIKGSFVLGSKYRCYAAYTSNRLDGLVCLSVDDEVTVELLSTAPWNYGKDGKIRRIGSGLLFFAMKNSSYVGREGRLRLFALPDAEPFYERIGMVVTGHVNQQGLREYRMPDDDALLFMEKFEKYVV